MSKIDKIKLYTPLPQYRRKQFNWHYLVIILLTIFITGAIVRLADALHYNGVKNQLSQQDNLVITNEGKDIQQLMSIDNSKLQCSQYISTFAQQECQTHNQQL